MKSLLKVTLSIILVILIMAFSKDDRKKVLFFGDSITYNGTSWDGAYINKIASLAKDEGITEFDFIGSGVPGDRVSDLYLRMDKDLLDQSPDVVVIFIGVNDIWHKILSGTGTDFRRFDNFYEAIVNKLISEGIEVIVCTPACIGEKTDFTNECDGDLNKYSQWIREYAQEKNLPLVDLRKAFLSYNLEHNTENKSKGILTGDGVHLKPEGSELVAREIWGELREVLLNLK